MNATGRQRTVLRCVIGAALVGLLIHALHGAFGVGGPALDGLIGHWIYNGLIVVSAALCLTRGITVRAERASWLFLGAGLASWALAELYYTLVLAKLQAPPYPSLSDAFYLAFYPLSYLGLVLLVRGRVREFHRSQWVDGVVAALAVSAFGAAVLVQPVLESTGGTALTVATDLAYPLGDVLLLALVTGMFAVAGWRPQRSWVLIGAGLVGLAVADGIFLIQVSTGDYTAAPQLDSLWPAATLLLGLAACTTPRRQPPVRLEGWRMLVIPSTVTLAALGLLMAAQFTTISRLAAALAGAALIAAVFRMALTFAEYVRVISRSQHQALTDALTGLGNRRRLVDDLQDELGAVTRARPLMLALFDLDGFKSYNDTFGHPAGDALLARLGRHLDAAVAPYGRAYRLGGDEFCVLVRERAPGAAKIVDAAAAALSDEGDGFSVGASCGRVLLPQEAETAERALQIADQRLYGEKAVRRTSAIGDQTRDVLIQALRERVPDLGEHLDGVADLARAVGRRLHLRHEELEVLVRAAELHDIGKVAVPDSILHKAGSLDELEWEFVRQHTLVGDRILNAAPALVPVATLVRGSHERWDGKGYPDGLAGEEIPLGSRIIAVCDAFHAMTSDRSYREGMSIDAALAELRRCSGRQFDPRVTDAFCDAVAAGEHLECPPRAADDLPSILEVPA
jgi:diguanylate cyclase (GGDEF)-like protein